jgi:hypothetical protein
MGDWARALAVAPIAPTVRGRRGQKHVGIFASTVAALAAFLSLFSGLRLPLIMCVAGCLL